MEYAPEIRRVVAISELGTAFPTVQFLPDDEVLVVGARCEWRPAPEGPEHNAAVFDLNGRPVRTGVLGDGIEHVQVTSEGRIWVGYFDEGVFGRHGWSDPIGRPGLICFDGEFRPIRSLDELRIDDCYALNVDGETAWTCYYTDFPVVRVDDGRVTSWDNDIRGARALAVAGERVALVFGYGGDDTVSTGRLVDGRFRVEDRRPLRLPDGARPEPHFVAGRGRMLHVVQDTTWFTATLTR